MVMSEFLHGSEHDINFYVMYSPWSEEKKHLGVFGMSKSRANNMQLTVGNCVRLIWLAKHCGNNYIAAAPKWRRC